MLTILDNAYIAAKNRIHRASEEIKEGWSDFVHSEEGVSAIVATILLILIVVLLAVIFWNSISEWLSQLWATITGKGNELQGQDTSGTF